MFLFFRFSGGIQLIMCIRKYLRCINCKKCFRIPRSGSEPGDRIVMEVTEYLCGRSYCNSYNRIFDESIVPLIITKGSCGSPNCKTNDCRGEEISVTCCGRSRTATYFVLKTENLSTSRNSRYNFLCF